MRIVTLPPFLYAPSTRSCGAWLATLALLASGCGASSSAAVRPDCPLGQTNLDGTCVSQPIADYVGCIRATGATVAADSARSLSAAAGAAGVSASSQAEVRDKLERSYAQLSDANTLEIIRNCYTSTNRLDSATSASQGSAQSRADTASGTWEGTYSYPTGGCAGKSGTITLTINETNGSLSGTDVYRWEGGAPGTWLLSGSRDGKAIRWVENGSVPFEGSFSGDAISGWYDGQCGRAQMNVRRRSDR